MFSDLCQCPTETVEVDRLAGLVGDRPRRRIGTLRLGIESPAASTISGGRLWKAVGVCRSSGKFSRALMVGVGDAGWLSRRGAVRIDLTTLGGRLCDFRTDIVAGGDAHCRDGSAGHGAGGGGELCNRRESLGLGMGRRRRADRGCVRSFAVGPACTLHRPGAGDRCRSAERENRKGLRVKGVRSTGTGIRAARVRSGGDMSFEDIRTGVDNPTHP